MISRDLKSQARIFLSWVNDNTPSPSRVRYMVGRDKTMMLMFHDSTSESIGERAKQNQSIVEDFPSAKEKLELAKHGDFNLIPELERIADKYNNKAPIDYVWMAMTIVGTICEEFFHRPEKLKKLVNVLSRLHTELKND